MKKNLSQHVFEMRRLGEVLVPYNFPKAPPTVEDDINILKIRELTVDGYDVCCHYSKSDQDGYFMESFQIFGKHFPFLPFSLVCKLARHFLGEHELSLIEIYRENRKIYCWTLAVDFDGCAIPSPYETEVEYCTYEGFNYCYMQPNQVDFH